MKTIALVALVVLVYLLLRRFGVISFINYGKGTTVSAMAEGTAERLLRASIGKRVQIVFTDGAAEAIDVVWVDEEGFGYTGPEPSSFARNAELVSRNPPQYWAPFGAVASIDGQS